MKSHIFPIVAFFGALALLPLAARADTLAQREAKSLDDFRNHPNDSMALENVALVREEMGYYDKARDTWNLIIKKFGAQESQSYSVSPGDNAKVMNYAELATWTLKRLERKRNLQSRPVSLAQKGAASRAETRFLEKPPVKYLEGYRSIDLDGDGIKEIVLFGSSGPLGRGKRNSISIHKWDGQNTYRPIWRATGRLPVEVEYGDYDKDEMKDGFGEVMLVYTPHSDDAANLHYNGSSFMIYGQM